MTIPYGHLPEFCADMGSGTSSRAPDLEGQRAIGLASRSLQSETSRAGVLMDFPDNFLC
jgi:hypothetical protein